MVALPVPEEDRVRETQRETEKGRDANRGTEGERENLKRASKRGVAVFIVMDVTSYHLGCILLLTRGCQYHKGMYTPGSSCH